MVTQFVDPNVSLGKFNEELADYRELESEYRRRGWFLLDASYPLVRILLAAPQLKPPAIVTAVSFDFSNYDAEPPSVKLVDPFSGAPYLARDLPTSLNRSVGMKQALALPGFPGGALRLNQLQPLMQAQSPDDVPFLCMAGVREYHEHPAHSGDSWELHRTAGAGRLVRLLDIITRYGVEPIQTYSVQLVPQVAGFNAPEAPE
jgi:hypothetical protein